MDLVQEIRAFNRFYTQEIGVLNRSVMGKLNLAQARVLYELNHGQTFADGIAQALAMDPGNLSKLVQQLKKKGLLKTEPFQDDRRRNMLSLTPSGHRMVEGLNRQANQIVTDILERVPREDFVKAMRWLRFLLQPNGEISFRDMAFGDLGHLIQRHVELYGKEFGWGPTFEIKVSEALTTFQKKRGKRERAWIAEVNNSAAGCIFCCDQGDFARLRMLLVEPVMRGSGLGSQLVNHCIDWAKGKGFAGIQLWTCDQLKSARRIYERVGFEVVDRGPDSRLGFEVQGETWELVF